jgi:hypothetical protein
MNSLNEIAAAGPNENEAAKSVQPAARAALAEEDLAAIKPDIDLRLLGWSGDRIRRVRRRLAKERPREGRLWQQEEDTRLGTREVAKITGRQVSAVTKHRRRLRIPNQG